MYFMRGTLDRFLYILLNFFVFAFEYHKETTKDDRESDAGNCFTVIHYVIDPLTFK